jgi:hypothetical protein
MANNAAERCAPEAYGDERMRSLADCVEVALSNDTPTNDWIPCWLSMPTREHASTHSDWFLVTVEVNDTRIVWFAQYRFRDRTWWDAEGRAVLCVTAWRELPEPFHEVMPRRQPAAAG